MTDREKVINGLECCAQYPNEYGDCLGGDCPYGPRIECHKELIHDALAMLKQQAQDLTDIRADLQESIADNLRLQELVNAQEPVKPVLDIDTWKCGKCGHTLEHQELLGDNVLLHEQYNYCPECGRAVKWE